MEKGLKLSTKSDSPAVDETEFRQLIGNLIYLTATRPNIYFAVSYISRFRTTPKDEHWIARRRVLQNVKGTSDYGILYSSCNDPKLIGYTDSDWARSMDDKKSTSGYVFSLGTSVITWSSKKRQVVALSSVEVEYQGTAKAACEAVWL
ncbi:secreted RxLR effector protein 161-like [Cryptomeria japonica]|uniref:secreted RxLR effector protein 161-like n=1 Tax=Cryptomeria japonica TaxID=3369 RepID=UPI0027DA3BEE|nr:secreted RxLR effector protein 161-like [Cryptomeria japonica]